MRTQRKNDMETSKQAVKPNKIAKNNNLEGIAKGRPKGSVNKVAKIAKDAIAEAAEMLGGVDRLVEWVKEDTGNEKVFWGTIYPKLLPLQVNADIEGAVSLNLVVKLIE
jgi:hypothetical protein